MHTITSCSGRVQAVRATSVNAGTQPGGIQQGAGADDAFFRDVGDLAEHIGQDIHGVGHDDVSGIGADGRDLGGNVFEDIHIGVDQVNAGLAGLAAHTGGDDDEVAALCGGDGAVCDSICMGFKA